MDAQARAIIGLEERIHELREEKRILQDKLNAELKKHASTRADLMEREGDLKESTLKMQDARQGIDAERRALFEAKAKAEAELVCF